MVFRVNITTHALFAIILIASGCAHSSENTVSRGADKYSAAVSPFCALHDQEHCTAQVFSLRNPQRDVVYETRADVVRTNGAPNEAQDDAWTTVTTGDSPTPRKTFSDDTLESAPVWGQ